MKTTVVDSGKAQSQKFPALFKCISDGTVVLASAEGEGTVLVVGNKADLNIGWHSRYWSDFKDSQVWEHLTDTTIRFQP
jgi:hypothetical protein